MILNDVSRKIIGCAFTVHHFLGPGLLESTYETCLEYELHQRGLRVDRQKSLPIRYKKLQLDGGFRIDLLVEDQVIVELKSVERVLPIHEAQILTYLRLTRLHLALLLNFNVVDIKRGLRRFVM